MTLEGKDILKECVLEVLEPKDHVEVMVIFEGIVEVFVVEPLDMRVEPLKEVRQVVDLGESKLQLYQHILDMIDLIP